MARASVQRLQRAVEDVVDVQAGDGVGLEVGGDREGHQLSVWRERDVAAIAVGVHVFKPL